MPERMSQTEINALKPTSELGELGNGPNKATLRTDHLLKPQPIAELPGYLSAPNMSQVSSADLARANAANQRPLKRYPNLY